jgi:DNA-binding LytR/AlgR family response regulator
MRLIQCIIVDDEPQARNMMENFVSQISMWKIVKVCSNAIDAFEVLQTQQVDVMFLDIKMPVVNGVDFLRSLNNPPLIIFTTAYQKYAMEGYELNVVDYLLKPIAMHRLLKATEKAAERLALRETETNYLFVKHEHKLVKIDFDAILYVEAMQNFVTIHTNTKSYLITQTMKAMEEALPAHLFTRVHRSYIIAMKSVTAVFGNTIEMETTQIPIGSNFRAAFMDKIERTN